MKKKDRERYQLERFKAVFPGFLDGTVADGKDDGTEPDFFVNRENNLLGIELTELYRTPEPKKQPRQAAESSRNRIVERACAIHTSKGGPALDVSVHFSMNQEWSKNSVDLLATKLAQLVLDHAPRKGAGGWLHNPWMDPDYFPFEIDSIDVRVHRWLTKAHWSASDADFMPEAQILLTISSNAALFQSVDDLLVSFTIRPFLKTIILSASASATSKS
jgi:hypothetical protein